MAQLEFKWGDEDKFPIVEEVPLVKLPNGVSLYYVDFTDRPTLITSLTDKLVMALAKKYPDLCLDAEDVVIVTMATKGIPYAQKIADLLGIDKIVILTKKEPMIDCPVVIECKAITHDKVTKLYLNKEDHRFLFNKKVVLIDDVISTGATIKRVIDELSYFCDVVAIGAIGKEGHAADDLDFAYLTYIPFGEDK